MAPDLAHLFDPGTLDVGLVEAVARAGYAVWQYNGHDVPGALAEVYRQHVNPAVREAAGEAHAAALAMPVVWRGFEIEFEARDRADR